MKFIVETISIYLCLYLYLYLYLSIQLNYNYLGVKSIRMLLSMKLLENN